MADQIRILNEDGATQFGAWLEKVRAGSKEAPPRFLLESPSTSESFEPIVMIEQEPNGHAFASRYDLGEYLKDRFSSLTKTIISRNAGLWNWLSLYYIDQVAPPGADGTRKIFEQAFYLLGTQFNFRNYYRHAIREPWLAVAEHGELSKVLLVPAGKIKSETGALAHRGEIFEQLAAYQWVMGSSTIIGGANKLYMDPAAGKPRRGSASSGGGSPRRLSAVIQQLDLTYDLRDCNIDQFVNLLPKEFEKWKQGEGT